MDESSFQTFVTGVLLRRTVLRAFAAEIIKFTAWYFTFLGTLAVVQFLWAGEWVRSDTWGLIGAAIGLFAVWSLSVIRTISAAYREFNAKR